MPLYKSFYINGAWRTPSDQNNEFPIINPATEEAMGHLTLATQTEVDAAIQAASDAFNAYSQAPLSERIALLKRIRAGYEKRLDDIAQAISTEMGAPISLAKRAQAPLGLAHLDTTLALAESFAFEEQHEGFLLRHEAAGVAALITPWNWPMNQALCKIAPALLAGCTMVYKPSELAPLSAIILAEIIAEANPPKGVFNMIFGQGEYVGPLLSSDPRIDVVSLTGSNRAGVSVSTEAAPTIKRVALELGGKSPNIVLPDCDLEQAIKVSVRGMMNNTGQSCNAPSRLLVPNALLSEAEALIKEQCQALTVGDPQDENTQLGPIANQRQYERVKYYIQLGQDEGATLLIGGTERPKHLSQGFYISPTVFSQVRNDMQIAREEIFGPVLCVIPYDTVEEAIAIANDTHYGLSAYIQGKNEAQLLEVAAQLRAGNVHINGARAQMQAPFGGYKQSGIGREWGVNGLHEFLEKKAVFI
ncbi:MAG TPA: aldehyde dehydrogenase family protein [Alcanivoracaceae bacterium]|nr:aldehyde dehydrogenase family protein [Alcanivoracaceae bacterium]